MGMPHAARRYTVDEVLAFPADGNRYELVAGELLVTLRWRVAPDATGLAIPLG